MKVMCTKRKSQLEFSKDEKSETDTYGSEMQLQVSRVGPHPQHTHTYTHTFVRQDEMEQGKIEKINRSSLNSVMISYRSLKWNEGICGCILRGSSAVKLVHSYLRASTPNGPLAPSFKPLQVRISGGRLNELSHRQIVNQSLSRMRE